MWSRIVYCYTSELFFFKQKTAYEMRISDWSSDVCSSDLRQPISTAEIVSHGPSLSLTTTFRATRLCGNAPAISPMESCISPGVLVASSIRSEEHTSELQSLMRISYAVFCLKKKKHNKTQKVNKPTIVSRVRH